MKCWSNESRSHQYSSDLDQVTVVDVVGPLHSQVNVLKIIDRNHYNSFIMTSSPLSECWQDLFKWKRVKKDEKYVINCNRLLVERCLKVHEAGATKCVRLIPGIQGGCEQLPPLPEQRDAAERESVCPAQSWVQLGLQEWTWHSQAGWARHSSLDLEEHSRQIHRAHVVRKFIYFTHIYGITYVFFFFLKKHTILFYLLRH